MKKYIIIIFFILIFMFSKKYTSIYQKKNVCRDFLSDKEYLEHMIPHHQVAVDISIMYKKICKNPTLQKIMRELIWTQTYEIDLMKNLLNSLPKNISSTEKMETQYYYTVGDFTKPNFINLSNTFCDPHFFDPDKHIEHLHHIDIKHFDDNFYIVHMIPHHQVAVDMSKVLLKNTKNDFMINLAYRIIRSQQKEIFILDQLKKGYNYSSSIIT